MAIGKGGSQQRQSGSESGSYSGETAFDSSGSFDQSGFTRPTTPEGWQEFYNQIQPGQGALDPATDYFRSRMNPGQEGSAFTLATLSQNWPELYSKMDPVTAESITANRGIDFLEDYRDEALTNVIDPTLAAYDQNAAESFNALRAQNAGAFGNKRFGVAEGQFSADNAMNRALTEAGLRRDAFTTAADLGFRDVGNILTADMSNADRSLAAQQFNNQMQTQREMFDVNAAYRGAEGRDQAARDFIGSTVGNQALGTDWLNAGLALFGQESGQSGTSQESGTGTSSGTSQSTTRGNSSGKSGGVSIG